MKPAVRRRTTARYSTLSIATHWLMLLLLAAVYISIELRGEFPKGSATREAMKTWHFMLGLLVFVLVWGRLSLRWRSGTPPITPAPPRLQHLMGAAMHAALYAFMIVMPMLGWLLLSASGKPIPFFGLELPALMGPSTTYAETIKEVHETIGEIGYWLVGLHAAASLYHHYFLRDDTLLRMLRFRTAGRS